MFFYGPTLLILVDSFFLFYFSGFGGRGMPAYVVMFGKLSITFYVLE